MGNRHIKTINGRKYYYESIRKGKKVTSRYLGPVEPLRKRKDEIEEMREEIKKVVPEMQEDMEPEKIEEKPEDSYIG